MAKTRTSRELRALRVSPDQMRRIDEWIERRKKQLVSAKLPDMVDDVNFSSAVRHLVDLGLAAEGVK